MRDSTVSPAGGGDTILPFHHRPDVKTTAGSRALDQLHQVDHPEWLQISQNQLTNQPKSAETQPESAGPPLLHLKRAALGTSGSAADTHRCRRSRLYCSLHSTRGWRDSGKVGSSKTGKVGSKKGNQAGSGAGEGGRKCVESRGNAGVAVSEHR